MSDTYLVSGWIDRFLISLAESPATPRLLAETWFAQAPHTGDPATQPVTLCKSPLTLIRRDRCHTAASPASGFSIRQIAVNPSKGQTRHLIVLPNRVINSRPNPGLLPPAVGNHAAVGKGAAHFPQLWCNDR